ncbi:MAG: hypothetical protein NOU37_08540 [Candidatus Brocadiales bacterium]|nr:hypothetical protein [Candidatus Bathyanammoxibius sp.]MCQ4575278.1 hypothetical protein [Candidatus Bathyanammoxibius amoris]
MSERKENWQDMSYAFWAAFDLKRVLLGFVGVLASVLWVCGILWPFSVFKIVQVSPVMVVASFLKPPAEGAGDIFTSFSMAFTSGNWKTYIPLALIIFGLLAIWSIIGGAITRIASLEYARGTKVGLVDSVKYSTKKFWSYFWGPMAPLVGVLFFVLLNVLGGFIGQVKFLEVLVAIGFPVILVFSFLILFVGIIGAVGAGLMFPTISADGSDAFDAMSRAYSYVLSKPAGFVIYCASAAVYGTICVYLVATAVDLLISTSFTTVGMGMGEKFQDVVTAVNGLTHPSGLATKYGYITHAKFALNVLGSKTLVFTAITLVFYLLLIKLMVWAVAAAFVGSAQSVLYLLMRKDVDGTEVEDVYIEETGADFTTSPAPEEEAQPEESPPEESPPEESPPGPTSPAEPEEKSE